MDFDLSPEQTQLKDGVDRLIASTYGSLETRQKLGKEPLGFSEAVWARFAEMGLTGIPFSEDEGGFGGGPVETLLVMEALGRGLALEPYFATVVLGGGAVRLGGSDALKQSIIPGIVEGTSRLALAFTEKQSRHDLFDVATSARNTAEGYVLEGAKSVVIHGDSADLIVVSARTAGSRRDRDGISLFLVPADAPGVKLHGYPTQDGGRAAEIAFSDVAVSADDMIGAEGGGLPILERVAEFAIAALASEAVGIMEALHRLTIDYLKTRQQFGSAIAQFQVLQHRAVDMLIALEQARSMAAYAAMMVEHENTSERAAALSAVKVQVNRSCRIVGQEAVQLHGGIGMTMEYLGAHYFKRLTMIESLFGDTAHHLRLVDRAGGTGSMNAVDKLPAAAAFLLAQWRAGTKCEAMPESLQPADRRDAYAMQALLERSSSAPLFGWKIAATSKAGQAHIGVDGPLAGRILAERVLADGSTTSLAGNAMRVAEVEFAFRMAYDLTPRETPYGQEDVLDAVASLHPAIEVPDSRFADFVAAGGVQLVADNACAHEFVLGESTGADWRGLDLAAFRPIGRMPGREDQIGLGANVLGDPRIALTWLVNELSGLGVTLKAGEVVTTGTCVVPIAIAPGDSIEADFGVLGRVSVSFA